jgi:hypothetical protein
MLIHIRHLDKIFKGMQIPDWYRHIFKTRGETKEFYTDRKPGFIVLYGSILTMLGATTMAACIEGARG